MKLYFTLFILFLQLSLHAQAVSSLEKLDSHWIKLTPQGGSYVVFIPCDARNDEFRVNSSKMTLVMSRGQEDEIFKILNYTTIDDLNATMKMRYDSYDGDKETDVFIKFLDRKNKIARWKFVLTRGGSSVKQDLIMIPGSYTSRYKTVEQPCKECWPEEDCESMGKNKAK